MSKPIHPASRKVPHIVLTGFREAAPQNMFAQQELLRLIAKAHAKVSANPDEDEAYFSNLLGKFGVKPEKIAVRGLESPEISLETLSILTRSEFFGRRAGEVLTQLFPQGESAPDHIVHVTCTGYVSPSPAQCLIDRNGFSGKTNVTHAYHMGCYAALPAVRMAEGFVAAGEGSVDIVHTEMCTLHFNPNLNSAEQLVVQSLFADGHIRYTAKSAMDHALMPSSIDGPGFRVLAIKERLIANSQADMSWIAADWGMKMTLSREVPVKIGRELRGFLSELATAAGCDLGNLVKSAYFAVHPGGPRIVEAVQSILELSDDQVRASQTVLKNRGNMSSSTLPHVWNEILKSSPKKGEAVVSLAFGPGLTIFGSVFLVN